MSISKVISRQSDYNSLSLEEPDGKLLGDALSDSRSVVHMRADAKWLSRGDFQIEGNSLTASKLWSNERPYVNSLTLKLTLSLIHVCKFNSELTRLCTFPGDQPRSVFEFEVADCKLYVCTPNIHLDTIIEPGPNELFILKSSSDITLLFFMRRLPTSVEYRILQCCFCFGISLSPKSVSKPSSAALSGYRTEATDAMGVPVSIFDQTVAGAQKEINMYLESIDRYERDGAQNPIFDKPPDSRGLPSHIFRMFCQLISSPGRSVIDPYIDFLLYHWPSCSAMDEGELIFMEFRLDEAEEVYEALNCQSGWPNELEILVPAAVNSWMWQPLDSITRIGVGKSIRQSLVQRLEGLYASQIPERVDLNNMRMRMRVQVDHLRSYLETSSYYKMAAKKLVCDEILNNGRAVLRSREPWNTPNAFCYYEWPKSFYEDNQVPGRVCQVTIS